MKGLIPMRPAVHPSAPPRLRSIALPTEHGSWGLVLEPILLGLLVAPSLAGAALAIGAFAAFLVRHPLKIARDGWRQRPHTPRTRAAWRFTVGYSLVALAGIAGGLWLASSAWPLLPLLLALPLLLIFAFYDETRPVRSWQAQMSAPAAFASVAASIALAHDWALGMALALWLLLLARSLPSIAYVRARLRLERQQPYREHSVIAAHMGALLLVVVLALSGIAPWLAVVAVAVLLARAAHGLSPYRRWHTTRAIGFAEMGFGIITVLLVATGFWIGV